MRHHSSASKVNRATENNSSSVTEEIEEQIIGGVARRHSPILEDDIGEELVQSDDNMLEDNAGFYCRPRMDQVKLEEIAEEVFEKNEAKGEEDKLAKDYVELKSFVVPYRRLRKPSDSRINSFPL